MGETIQPSQTETGIKEFELPKPVIIEHPDGRKTAIKFFGKRANIENGTFSIKVESPNFGYDRTLSPTYLQRLRQENPDPEAFKKKCIEEFKKTWDETVQQEREKKTRT